MTNSNCSRCGGTGEIFVQAIAIMGVDETYCPLCSGKGVVSHAICTNCSGYGIMKWGKPRISAGRAFLTKCPDCFMIKKLKSTHRTKPSWPF